MIREVCVIGAAGRIGLVNSIVMADSMLDVIGIDINAKAVKNLQTLQATTGKIPFIETNSDLPYNVSAFKNIKFTTSFDSLNLTDVIFIIMGTPVDSEGNGNLQPLLDFFRDYVVKAIDASSDRKLIILRSTVAPGTTDCLLDMIHSMTTKRNGKDFDLAFCPERVAQGEGLTEIISLPQLIGAYTEDGYNLAAQFFSKIGSFNALPIMTPTEAEIGKLMTNMYRYVNFAFANEMYMIGRNYGADIHKVISNCNKDYPRMKMPLPAPNTGGPCLTKDGKLLIETIPYCDLVQNAFIINESMPQYIFNESKKLTYTENTKIDKALILGMTFKKDNDDTRLSLSYKLKKILRKNNIEVVEGDGYIHDNHIIYEPFDFESNTIDVVYIMTPHDHLIEDYRNRLRNELRPNCVIVDVWKSLKQKETIFLNKDYK